MERIRLRISGEQTDEGGNVDRNVTLAEGSLFREGDRVRVEYMERPSEGADTVRSRLLLSESGMEMIREGEYGKAEDLLFENLVYSDKYIELASDFYQRLNQLSDDQLDAGNFSREEIYDGYIEIMALLGVPIDVFGQADRSEY